MYSHHFHTCIEQEDTASQNQVVKLGEVREEALRHIHVVMSARSYIDDTEDYKQSCGDDGSYHSAPFTYLAYPAESFHGDEGRNPIDCKHRDEGEHLVGG